jgi:hypothetical protein
VHGPHWSDAGLHTGFVPVQSAWESGVHSTQTPFGSSQTGVAAKPAHCASPVQPSHWWLESLQMGLAPGHSELVVHWTQEPLASSQTVPPKHWASPVQGMQV